MAFRFFDPNTAPTPARPAARSPPRLDGYDIRRCAVENNVTIFTALETVSVLLDVLEEITLGVSTIDAE